MVAFSIVLFLALFFNVSCALKYTARYNLQFASSLHVKKRTDVGDALLDRLGTYGGCGLWERFARFEKEGMQNRTSRWDLGRDETETEGAGSVEMEKKRTKNLRLSRASASLEHQMRRCYHTLLSRFFRRLFGDRITIEGMLGF